MGKNYQHARDVGEKYISKSLIKKWIQYDKSWDNFFQIIQQKIWFQAIWHELIDLEQRQLLIPNLGKAFQPFLLSPLDKLRVCIVGQEPYNSRTLATGIPFSSRIFNTTPPSLSNIKKELKRCYPNVLQKTNSLEEWTTKGIFLYNFWFLKTHKREVNKRIKHWCALITRELILFLGHQSQKIIYVLLGNTAKQAKNWIDGENGSVVLTFSHPSPLSAHRSFTNSRIFEKINQVVESPIDWNLKKT